MDTYPEWSIVVQMFDQEPQSQADTSQLGALSILTLATRPALLENERCTITIREGDTKRLVLEIFPSFPHRKKCLPTN